jgi:uncharacterized protein (AIM24 family)
LLQPVRVSAGWLTSRLLLFLVILAVLVAVDAYRDESTLLTAQLKGLLPDKEQVERLEGARSVLARLAEAREGEVNERLRQLPGQTIAQLDARIAALQVEIEAQEGRRRSSMQKTVALLTGEGFKDDLEVELEIQLLKAERDVLKRLKDEINARTARVRDAGAELQQTAQRTQDAWRRYSAAREVLTRHERANPVRVWIPGSPAWARSTEMTREANRLAREYEAAGEEFYRARDRWKQARAVPVQDAAPVQSATASVLEPFDTLIATRKAAVESAERQAERIRRSVQKVFLNALLILVAVTMLPVLIKAAWYHLLAPLVERRPPIRLRPNLAGAGPADGGPLRERISAVSIDVTLGEGEELLVHTEFLQSSAERARKDTKWLLSGSFVITSIVAGMVALTRIRGAGERFVVSSKNDPLAEVGTILLGEGESLVLQPRSLVGVVQRSDRPVRISSRWVFSLSAFVTFQFRYLIFDGPGQLLVQGCRGVRLEPAGTGRSIDQNATMGFSANLDYLPRRSETFGAYLLGVNGLFNDSFAGGPGFCVYEEMPYLGRSAGITGRGLEGLTDGLLKVFGI